MTPPEPPEPRDENPPESGAPESGTPEPETPAGGEGPPKSKPGPSRLDPLRRLPDAELPADADEPPTAGRSRLDPLRAAAASGVRPGQVKPVIDTRRYQWIIGIVGVTIVIVFSAYLLISHGITTPGVAPGQKMHDFVAPLATSGINLPANSGPHCNPRKPTAKALNMCDRKPIVLAFFVDSSSGCIRVVDALQKVSSEFPTVEFAALAVNGSLKTSAKLVRTHHWTIQIGVDSDGRVGEVYGVGECPIVEIARAGGIVVKRLVGYNWANAGHLATQVRALTDGDS
jgi:peroxiredoxin